MLLYIWWSPCEISIYKEAYEDLAHLSPCEMVLDFKIVMFLISWKYWYDTLILVYLYKKSSFESTWNKVDHTY